VRRRLKLELARIVRPPDVTIAHWFRPPPYGGSNQFLLALRDELRRRGLRVGEHVVAPRTRACVLNSFAFDTDALRRTLHPGCRVVHRVDGPVALVRGRDDGVDELVARLNAELAHATVFQSHYSLDASRELGLDLRNPVVIPNAVDPRLFHPPPQREPLAGRRIRLISSSWSDNPNKGAAALAELERKLDWRRFDLTFVGRSPVRFVRTRSVAPLPSAELARVLREHDVFVFASRHEASSNALLEALACGLPAVYVDSGGNGEVVGDAGISFQNDDELPEAVERMAAEVDARRARIAIPTLEYVTDRYLATMGIEPAAP
jgi:glycosyltransferase involved in cell wall biosynthesis